MRRLAVLLVVLGVPAAALAVGEPSNGFPSPEERLGLMAINRARSDPSMIKGTQSTVYPARPPVIWSRGLNESARFHASNLKLTDVALMHDSPCTLNTNVASAGCSGDPSCACAVPVPGNCAMCASVAATGACGTSWSTRVGYFTSGMGIGVTGEVAAAGYGDPIATVNGWMDEAAGNDGHRKNLTDQGITSNTMGYGRAEGKPACFPSFDISDSGSIKNATIPKIPTAAVSPSSGNAGTFTFYATWADPANGAPRSLNVVLDGACVAMARELGTDTLNATYKATAPLTAGCHQYAILATDANGASVVYPTTGALTIAVGSGTCSTDYDNAAVVSCGADGGVAAGTGGAAGAAGSMGAGGSSSGGGTGSGGVTASGGATGTGGMAATGGSNGEGGIALGGGAKIPPGSSGCTCAAGDAQPRAGGVILLVSMLFGVARRRRACAGAWSVRR